MHADLLLAIVNAVQVLGLAWLAYKTAQVHRVVKEELTNGRPQPPLQP